MKRNFLHKVFLETLAIVAAAGIVANFSMFFELSNRLTKVETKLDLLAHKTVVTVTP